MGNKEVVIIADYSEQSSLSFQELCDACGITPDAIYELIEYEIVSPEGVSPDEWVFNMAQLQRAKTALRLQRDLEVNLAGIALILDLLEELDDLRARIG